MVDTVDVLGALRSFTTPDGRAIARSSLRQLDDVLLAQRPAAISHRPIDHQGALALDLELLQQLASRGSVVGLAGNRKARRCLAEFRGTIAAGSAFHGVGNAARAARLLSLPPR